MTRRHKVTSRVKGKGGKKNKTKQKNLDNTLRQPTPPTTVTSAQFPRGRGRNHHLLSARGLCYEENPVREPRASYCIKISETGKKKQVGGGRGAGGKT